MKKQSLEQTLLTALQECLEKVPFVQIDQMELAGSNSKVGALIRLRVQNLPVSLLLNVKNNGQPRLARLAIYELKEALSGKVGAYSIFAAPYISPETGKLLEEAGIGYVDLAGNCLLSFETIYIRQVGLPNPKVKKRDLRSLYSPKAERILRVLLNEPKRVWRVTELAQASEVSLGQVANVKKLLLDREWASTSDQGVRLVNPTKLLDEWRQVYNFQRNDVREYYAMAEIPEIEAQLAAACQQLEIPYALTGFSSAARIAPMVRYQKASAYINGDAEALIQVLKWKSVSSGANVSLLIPYDNGIFYGAKDVDTITITTPVQTYLDLQHHRGRGQEAAQAVRREIEKTW